MATCSEIASSWSLSSMGSSSWHMLVAAGMTNGIEVSMKNKVKGKEMLVILWEAQEGKNSLQLHLVGPDQRLTWGWEIHILLHKTADRVATPHIRPSE